MAEESNGAAVIQTAAHIPIAQLTPLLSAPASRSIKAVVTLTWPYSSATGSVAFLLSEPDFRLRRTRGQVRVRFSGSSAKEVAKSGIASGDQVVLSLDGAEWIHDEAAVATPGKGVEFELKFTERLVLQFKQEDSQDAKTIDIDHPASEPEVVAPPRIPTPELAISPSAASSHPSPALPDSVEKVRDEWISPAFIKRARTSYGSLFESDYDPFAEEDGTVPGKGRKRTRLSSTWRYSSRSPTPEAEEEVSEPILTPPESVAKPYPVMRDEGCQTIGLEDGGAAEALANFARQATNVGRDSYVHLNGTTTQKPIVQEDDVPRNTLSAMGPTPFSLSHTNMDGLQQVELDQNAPQPPYLHPVSSDFVLQVSPLVSARDGALSENLQLGVTENGRYTHDQANIAHSHPPTLGQEAEDIYGASPTGRRGDETQLGVSGFHNPPMAVNGIQTSRFEERYLSEDKHGHWQNPTAELSHHASPYLDPESVGENAPADRFYVEEGEHQEQYTEDGFPTLHAEMLRSHQYPEIDDGLPSQHSSAWGLGAAHAAYPKLQDHGVETGMASHPSQPHSAAMSRSQSGQSQVVDLTESSDEEVEERPAGGSVEEEGSILEEEDGEEDREGSAGEAEEGSLDEEQEERESDVVRSRYFPRDDTLQQDFEDEEEDQSDQEDYYDDDMEENEPDAGFNLRPGQYGHQVWDNEEEGSYEDEDEDMEEDRPVQRDPVVIDLLSSDDEEDGPSVQPTSTVQHESEESDEEEHDDENDVPYTERYELKTRALDSVKEDDDVMEYERDQDDVEKSTREDESDDETDEEPSPNAETGTHGEQSLAQDFRESSEEIQLADQEHGDLADVESLQRGDQHQESEIRDGPTRTDGASHFEPSFPGQFGRPTLFSRIFNFDGANDEPQVEVSYPTLPKDEPSSPTPDQQTLSQIAENVLQRARNAQLPTPDATQSFGKTISPDASFTSTTDVRSSQTKLHHESDVNTTEVEMKQVKVTVDASGPLESKADTAQTETTAVTLQTEKITIEDEDVEMSQEGHLESTLDPKLTDLEPLKEQTVNQELNLETISEPKGVESQAAGESLIAEEAVMEAAEDSIAIDSGPPAKIEDMDMVPKERVEDTAQDAIIVDTAPLEETENLDAVAEEPAVKTTGDAITLDPDHPKESENLDVLAEEPARDIAEDAIIVDTAPLEETENLDAVVEEPALEIPEDAITLDPDHPKEREYLDVVAEEPAMDIAEDTIAVDSDPPKTAESLGTGANELEFTVDSPRRSHRRVKPTVTITNTKENNRAVTPTKPGNGGKSVRKEHASPKIVLDSRAPPKGHDASIELALSSLESPSKQQHDLRKQPVADLKLRLSRALRTELSEFTALKVLRYHLNQKLDVLAVATSTPAEPIRAKNGPRHYQITFNVTDPSIAPSGVTEVQIFRPYKDALPTIKEGDGILLRNFQVISVKSRGFGLRSVQDEGSSWAVFKDEGEAEVRGPPVEFGDGEKNHAIALKAWYDTLDAVAMAKISRANGDKAGAGVGKSMMKAS